MNRRNFIKSKVAGTAILASSGLVCKASAKNPPAANNDTSIIDVDILVVGGGSAGHVAAIQAGRLGAKTVLLERNSQLGGTQLPVVFASQDFFTLGASRSFPELAGNWSKILWKLMVVSFRISPKITDPMFPIMLI